jgi:ATP-dependent DNA helicase RecG
MSESGTGRLAHWLQASEGEHLEFKEARESFSFERLLKHCAALANERGGTLVLGVTDKRPRKVVGTNAFGSLERTRRGLLEKLRYRVDVEEISHPDGRVLAFRVPSRPIGMPIPLDGAYWMRSGDSLATMTADMLKRVFDEAGPDFSAELCPGATLDDLAPDAVEDFRARWLAKSANDSLRKLPAEQLLSDAEVVVDGGLTYAALILFGNRAALGRYLAQAEVVLEYRSSEASGPAQKRWEFREGFFSYYDGLWTHVNEHNDLQHFQDRLFVWDLHTFNEAVLRESILNAVRYCQMLLMEVR